MSTETQQPHELDKFQVWWNYHGQYCRSGGGEYEESFAWAAWQAAQSSQAAELAALKADIAKQATEIEALRKDAERLDWLHQKLFVSKWNGVIDSGSRTSWHIAGDYRHTTVTMNGATFREAIDAAMQTKEAS